MAAWNASGQVCPEAQALDPDPDKISNSGRFTPEGGLLLFRLFCAFALVQSCAAGFDPTTSPSAFFAPRITEHPASAAVPRQVPMTLNCKAEGRPAPMISWEKDGERLQVGASFHRHQIILPGGPLFFLHVEASDAGVYRCVATNSAGQTISKEATLDVASLRRDFRVVPVDLLVSAGDRAVLQCGPPRGRPDPTVSWRKDGRTLDVQSDRRVHLADGSDLVIEDARPSDTGRYQCVAQNAAGVRETPGVLIEVAVPPVLMAGPVDTTAVAGSTVDFPCAVNGEPLPNVTWRRSGLNGMPDMPPGAVVTQDRSLRIPNVQPEHAGQYTCEADNKVGAITASAKLSVVSLPLLTSTRPSVLTAQEGEDVTLSCTWQATPTPAMFWSVQGNHAVLYPGYKLGRFSVQRSTQSSTALTIQNLTRTDSGVVVECFAVNLAGSAVSRTSLLVLRPDELPPPVITVGPSNQTLTLNSTAFLPCKATGQPDPDIRWLKNHQPLTENSNKSTDTNGSLIFNDVGAQDGGEYTCVASSPRGTSSWTAWISVSASSQDSSPCPSGPSVPPGAPSRPLVVNSTNTSVTLAWRRNNKAGSAPLLGYQVEVYGPRQRGWQVVARKLSVTTYTQDQLTPGIAYTFLVRAENCHGLSRPSELTTPIILPVHRLENEIHVSTVEDSPVIRLSQLVVVSSTSIKLLWEVLDPEQVEELTIYWKAVGKNSLQSLPVQQKGTPSLGFLVTGLQCFNKYQFFVMSFNHYGEGRASNMQEARTFSEAPSAPPSQLAAKFLNASTVRITWGPPPAAFRNGAIESYEVLVTGGNPPELMSNVTLTADTSGSQQLLLSNLSLQVTYHLSVAAATSAGRGPFSAPLALISPSSQDKQERHLTTPNIVNSETSVGTGISSSEDAAGLLTEIWLMALLGSMVAVIVALFCGILFVQRRQSKTKKNAYPHLHMYDSRSNGGVLSLKEVEAEGAPLCISSPTGTRMIWETSGFLGMTIGPDRNNSPLPEYAEAQSLRSHFDESRTNSDYAEVKNKYAQLSTFQGKNGLAIQQQRNYGRPERSCWHCESPSQFGCECSSKSGNSDNSSSTAPYATTTLVSANQAGKTKRAPLPSINWEQSAPSRPKKPPNRRFAPGHYSDTYQCNEPSQRFGQKQSANTLGLKPLHPFSSKD